LLGRQYGPTTLLDRRHADLADAPGVDISDTLGDVGLKCRQIGCLNRPGF